jgi:hypothetical protein
MQSTVHDHPLGVVLRANSFWPIPKSRNSQFSGLISNRLEQRRPGRSIDSTPNRLPVHVWIPGDQSFGATLAGRCCYRFLGAHGEVVHPPSLTQGLSPLGNERVRLRRWLVFNGPLLVILDRPLTPNKLNL